MAGVLVVQWAGLSGRLSNCPGRPRLAHRAGIKRLDGPGRQICQFGKDGHEKGRQTQACNNHKKEQLCGYHDPLSNAYTVKSIPSSKIVINVASFNATVPENMAIRVVPSQEPI